MRDGVRCVVFDLDDTLYLEREYVQSGFEALEPWVKDRFQLSDFAAKAWELFEAGARTTIFDQVLQAEGVETNAEAISVMVSLYRAHKPKLSWQPDALQTVAMLRGRGTPLAVLTDGPAQSQRAKVEALEVENWVHMAVLTAELGPGRGKPCPDGFLKIQEVIGLAPNAFIYVGDNPKKDFIGPSMLGWKTARVRRPLGLHFEVPSGPDVNLEVRDLRELLIALDG